MTSGLPPMEVPMLQTAHLNPVSAGRVFSWSSFSAQLHPLPSRRWSALVVAGVLPFMALYLAQPNAPLLNTRNEQLLTSYLSEERRTPIAQAESTSLPLPEASPQPTEAPVEAELAASQNAPTSGEQAFRYQLTLADGFLKKAIQLSRSTAGQQSTSDQNSIQEYLNQALSAANKAIDLDSRSGVGFLVRARIYATAGAVKPELKAFSEQDLTIARALGISSASLDESQNPLEFLPTQQATNIAALPVVADAEEGTDTVVSSQQTDNLQQGQVTFTTGQTETIVRYPGLTANSVVTAKPLQVGNTPFLISKRETGIGFTIKALSPVTQDTEVAWSVTEE